MVRTRPALVGISIGVPTNGIGACVLAPSGEAIEAVTVMPDGARGTTGLVLAAQDLVGDASGILVDAGLIDGPVVWVVEDLPAPRPSRPQTKGHKAAAAKPEVQSAAVARAVMLGAVTASIPLGTPWITVAPQETPASPPAVLVGAKPTGWRGERGLRREVQRLAWSAACDRDSRLHPKSRSETRRVVGALIGSVEADLGLRPACELALDLVTLPEGAPRLTPAQVEGFATSRGFTS